VLSAAEVAASATEAAASSTTEAASETAASAVEAASETAASAVEAAAATELVAAAAVLAAVLSAFFAPPQPARDATITAATIAHAILFFMIRIPPLFKTSKYNKKHFVKLKRL
jgi:hypothetical protein